MTTKNATRRILRHFLAVFIAKMGIYPTLGLKRHTEALVRSEGVFCGRGGLAIHEIAFCSSRIGLGFDKAVSSCYNRRIINERRNDE